MPPRKTLFAVLMVVGFSAELHAQAPVAAPPLARYPGIRTQFNQSLSQALSNEQRLALYRQTVAQGGNSGRPMLMRMFGNFQPGSFNLSPTTPGLSTTVRGLASDNANYVKGHARTLRYAMSLQGDARFNVAGLNRPRVNSAGRTDADIVFRHQSTGLQVRMEVKNMTPASQRANLQNIQRQILKMAQDARMTGEMQVWANRQNVLPEVRAFAERHGIRVEERLRTGNTNVRPGDRSFQDFASGLDKELRLQAKLTAMAGSVKAGMGAYLAYQAIRQLEGDVSSFAGTHGDWLRIGEHGSTLLAGGGFGSAGAAQLARQIPALANSARLVSLRKWGGRLGVAGTVLAEGFLVGQYLSGDLTERQFWHGQASLGGGLAGGAAGGFVGFKAGALTGGAIGSCFGPAGTAIGAGIGGTIGAIGGGVGGGYAGAHFAGRGVESVYRLQDAEQQESYAQFLLSHYQQR
ncbi:MAG: hypothetical protein GXY83_11280 [Rhodopirellula sp.]|nr:hypothetical protein [Rhodopirellula sp.]